VGGGERTKSFMIYSYCNFLWQLQNTTISRGHIIQSSYLYSDGTNGTSRYCRIQNKIFTKSLAWKEEVHLKFNKQENPSMTITSHSMEQTWS